MKIAMPTFYYKIFVFKWYLNISRIYYSVFSSINRYLDFSLEPQWFTNDDVVCNGCIQIFYVLLINSYFCLLKYELNGAIIAILSSLVIKWIAFNTRNTRNKGHHYTLYIHRFALLKGVWKLTVFQICFYRF